MAMNTPVYVSASIGLVIALVLLYILFYYIYITYVYVDNPIESNELALNDDLRNDLIEHPGKHPKYKIFNDDIRSQKNNYLSPRNSHSHNTPKNPDLNSSTSCTTNLTVVDHFEYQVNKLPHHPALINEEGETMSYSQLDQLATIIQKIVYDCIQQKSDRTTTPTDTSDTSTTLVSVMIDRNFSFLVAMLGILKAGAAYVPVDPSFPTDRQIYIFNHSKCAFIILDESSYDKAISLGMELPPYIKMDTKGNIISMTINMNSSPNRNLTIVPSYHYTISEIIAYRRTHHTDRLAYVLYTSGSTGKPKGVMVKNVGVINIINWFADVLQVSPSSRVMGLTTFCFDISVLEMCVSLTRGATLILAKSSTQKDPFTLLDIMSRHQVTVFQATPTTYEMMLATGWSGDKDIDFLVGGEACRPSVLPIVNNCRSFRNVYGPTETTIWSTSYTITSDWLLRQQALTTDSKASIIVPIGTAISETDLYIVSENEPYTLMSEYAEGELWIGGVGVAAGYLNAPELTIGRFLKNPFGSGYVYRTGDIVKKLEDGTGNYIFVRRMDDQVKIGGYRIELQEIENVYLQHPAVEQAVALVRQNKLVIYLKLVDSINMSDETKRDTLTKITRDSISILKMRSDQQHTASSSPSSSLNNRDQIKTIQNFASKSLTHYMIPKATVLIDMFPQTANGKLDRKALPDPADSDYHTSSTTTTATDNNNNENDNDMDSTEIETTNDMNFHPDTTISINMSSVSSPKYVTKPTVTNQVVTSNGDLSPSITIMTAHIITVVEQIRGIKVKATATLAGLGVDSLGAVMFIRHLSSSLGGLRLTPMEIFAPNMTIKKLAKVIITKLEKDNPKVLYDLGITDVTSDHHLESGTVVSTVMSSTNHTTHNTNEHDSNNNHNEDDEDNDADENGIRYSDHDSSFEALIARNSKLIEGIRGALTILVLYDHFYPLKIRINQTIRMDTAMFIMMSGVTTALQLRQPLRVHKNYEQATTSSSTSHSYTIEETPRDSFDWKWFIATRLMGIFPIMWLAMGLNLPPWIHSIPFHPPTDGLCGVLHLTGLVIWYYEPYCHYSGPSSVIFASKIFNTFILYSFLRYIIQTFQRHSIDIIPRSLSNIMTLISYNRVSPLLATIWTFIALGLIGVCFVPSFLTKNAQTPQIFVFVFLSGVLAMSVVECWHSTRLWKKQQQIISTSSDTIRLDSEDNTMEIQGDKAIKHDHIWFSQLYTSIFTVRHTIWIENQIDSYLKWCNQTYIIVQLWRFLPDIMAIGFGLLFTSFPILMQRSAYLTSYGVTSLLIFFLLVTFLQEGMSRNNIIVTCLESPLASWLGYISFPVYLFQHVLFEYYTPLIGTAVNHEPFPYRLRKFALGPTSSRYFRGLPWYSQLVCVIVLLGLSHLVQKYFHDHFVMSLWGKLITYTTQYKQKRLQKYHQENTDKKTKMNSSFQRVTSHTTNNPMNHT